MRVKICGLTNVDDALVAVEAGADLLGLILYPKSPRYVAADAARVIVEAVRGAGGAAPLLVGVFVDEDWQAVAGALEELGLDLAQLSGSEPPVEVQQLRPRVYKAIRPRTRGDAEAAVATYAAVLPPTDPATAPRPSFIVDAFHPWQFGGTGEVSDWHAASVIARRYPILLAGGLTPDNVAAAIDAVQPWGVDVSSGVESTPGRKDHSRLRDFIAAARAARSA